ncbi:MAG: hypothetical protein OJF51_000330 [Nitrospira sp.]|jgi:hypothetical protein|nr:MAG: hypothetical protein OJF51_000330 [Nitrospira sp.]
MTMPRFTAEAALYKTTGHYQTNRNTINLPYQMGGTIGPALGISDEGPIEVHACRAGFIQIGEGANMVCVDPADPFGTRGHDGGGSGSGGPGGGDEDGGESIPSDADLDKPILFGCSSRQLLSKEAKPCLRKQEDDIAQGVNEEKQHYVQCTGKKKGRVVHPKMQCCQGDKEVKICDDLN